jgi:O-antigen ligase
MNLINNLFSNDLFLLLTVSISFICIVFFATIFILRNYTIAIYLAIFSPFVSAIFVSILGFQTQATLGSYIRVLIIFFIGTIGFFTFFKLKNKPLKQLPLQIKLLAVYILLAVASTIYSIDPSMTIIRSTAFLMFFGFLLGLFYWIKDGSDYTAVMNIFYYAIISILVINISTFIVRNDLVWYRGGIRFSGLWGHPNVFGMFAMVSYPVLLWKWHSKNYSNITHPFIFIFIFMIFHVLTGSRGSLLASLSGFSIWLMVLGKKIKLGFLILSLCLFAFILLYDIDEFKMFKRATARGSTMLTLTGRDEFWSAMQILIIEKPITGYGYGVGGKIWEDPRFHKEGHLLWSGSARTSLHNGYLSSIINTGFPAFIIWIILLFRPLIYASRLKSKEETAPLIFIMMSCFILNIIEYLITGGNSPASVAFWIAWLILGRMIDLEKTSKYN